MVTTARSKKLTMRVLIYYVVFGLAYIILSASTTKFFLTWGAERSLIERAYVQFIGGPFDWSKSLWLLPVNSVFWATIPLLLYIGANRVWKRT